jgi:hypothetical protein
LSAKAGWKKQKAGRRHGLIINTGMNMAIHRSNRLSLQGFVETYSLQLTSVDLSGNVSHAKKGNVPNCRIVANPITKTEYLSV